MLRTSRQDVQSGSRPWGRGKVCGSEHERGYRTSSLEDIGTFLSPLFLLWVYVPLYSSVLLFQTWVHLLNGSISAQNGDTSPNLARDLGSMYLRRAWEVGTGPGKFFQMP